MNLGDLLSGAGDWAKKFVNDFGIVAQPGAHLNDITNQLQQSDLYKPNMSAGAAAGLGLNVAFHDVMNAAGSAFAPVGAAVSHIPHGNEILQLPNRAWDTIFLTTAHADSVSVNQDSELAGLGAQINLSNWAKAWDVAGQPGHVTAGGLVANRFFTGDNRLKFADPLNANDAKAIQHAAETNKTWYSDMSAAATDLWAGFSVPGLGVATKAIKAGRAAKTVSTVNEANQLANRIAQVGVEGVVGSHKVTDKVRTLAGAQIPVDSKLASLVDGVNKTDGITSPTAMNDFLSPMLEQVPEAGRMQIADLFATVNRSVNDPALRTEAKVNILLAAKGSAAARRSLIENQPLIAVGMQRMSEAPMELKLAANLRDARIVEGQDTVNQVMNQTFNTAADQAELEHLTKMVQTAADEAKAARDLHRQILADKPTIKSFDAQRLTELRRRSIEQAQSLRAQLQQARQDLKDAKAMARTSFKNAASKTSFTEAAAANTSRTARDAMTALGPTGDVARLNEVLGQTRARVAQLEKDYAQAKADQQLFHATPMPGKDQLVQWRQDKAIAGDLRQQALNKRETLKAARRQQKSLITAKAAEMKSLHPALNRSNDILNSILDLGQSETSTAGSFRFQQTALDKLKTYFRDQIGMEHYLTATDANSVARVIRLPAKALSNRARGVIDLASPDVGVRQIGDVLKRSGEYTGPEIRAKMDQFMQASQGDRHNIVANIQNDMLMRLANTHLAGEFDNADQAVKKIQELANVVAKTYGHSHQWILEHANPVGDTNLASWRGVDGEVNVADSAALKSHLADSAPMIDPGVVIRELQKNKGGLGGWLRSGVDHAGAATDLATNIWRHGVLLRPGLGVRAALDTQLRSLAMLGTFETLYAGMIGSADLLRNSKTRAFTRARLSGADAATASDRIVSLGLKPVMIDVGNGRKIRVKFQEDSAHRAAVQAAMAKGGSPYGWIHPATSDRLGKLKADRTRWVGYQADSTKWVTAYREFAGQLMASPTAKWLAQNMFKVDGRTPEQLVREMMGTKAFRDEYAKIAQPNDWTREEFAQYVVHNVEPMFPNEGILNATLHGKLTDKMVKDTFPTTETRFKVPGPEVLKGPHGNDATIGLLKRSLDRFYGLVLDKPDMWLSRDPVGSMTYRRAWQREAKAMVDQHGNDSWATPEMIATIDRSARSEAIQAVRRTYFDTSRYTGAHHALRKISPFIAAWEDAMISWSRLIYDNPTRLARLAGAWNAPANLNPYLGGSLLIDQNGQPVKRGGNISNAFVQLPWKFPGGSKLRIRMGALNSIAQGGVWWLPGFGPSVTVPATQVLGRAVPHNVALDIVGTDNWLGKQLLNSMYLDGQIPSANAGDVALSSLPSWMRGLGTDIFGTNMAMNAQRNFNAQLMDAVKNGRPTDQRALNKMWDQATGSAQAAGVVRAIANMGFGMTGTAVLDGQFYADQMHVIQAIPHDQLVKMGYNSPEEYFSHLYPEAANLDWRLTKNDTGISATVHAQKSATQLNGVLKDYSPKLGWMVLGASNVGGQFSRTAYSQQVQDSGRKRLPTDQVKQQAEAAAGWQEYMSMKEQLTLKAKQYGLDPNGDVIRQVKSAYVDYLKQKNGAWADAYATRRDNFDFNYNQALKLSQDRRVKSRSDMVLFRQYADARQQVMDQLGLKSLSGTGPQSQLARKALDQLGQQFAARDLGFQQMWQRFLSSEVE